MTIAVAPLSPVDGLKRGFKYAALTISTFCFGLAVFLNLQSEVAPFMIGAAMAVFAFPVAIYRLDSWQWKKLWVNDPAQLRTHQVIATIISLCLVLIGMAAWACQLPNIQQLLPWLADPVWFSQMLLGVSVTGTFFVIPWLGSTYP